MKNYLDLLNDILVNGVKKEDRTGTGTLSVFSRDLRYNLQEGFPLVTTKKMHLKGIIHELLWFLKGDTNTKYLTDNKVTIWNEWADENGDLGPVYGKQWRMWETADGEVIDQISELIENIKRDPDSRRHMVSAWNVGELKKMALMPCHFGFQFVVLDGKLNGKFWMRSSDTFLGLPYNLASYAILTHMIAQQCDLEVGELVYSGTDVHLYNNHIEQAKIQITRKPYPLPTLNIKRKPDSIFDYTIDDFEIENYECHPAIKADVSI